MAKLVNAFSIYLLFIYRILLNGLHLQSPCHQGKMMLNFDTYQELLRVSEEMSKVDVEEVSGLRNHDVVIVAIANALCGQSKSETRIA